MRATRRLVGARAALRWRAREPPTPPVRAGWDIPGAQREPTFAASFSRNAQASPT